MCLCDGTGGDSRIACKEPGKHWCFFGAGDDPEDMATAVDDGVSERHAATVLVGIREGDFCIAYLTDGVARNQ